MPRKSSKTNTTNNKTTSTRSKKTTNESMKYEIANEYGVDLGANATARDNGKVGGEMTKRLVNKGKQGR